MRILKLRHYFMLVISKICDQLHFTYLSCEEPGEMKDNSITEKKIEDFELLTRKRIDSNLKTAKLFSSSFEKNNF